MPLLIVRLLGCQDYHPVWQSMQAFTESRIDDTPDELWLCQHPPVFTQGQAGDPAHLGALGDIPLVKTDRGGQVTYHGPGQLVFYPLIQLNRHKLGVKAFVEKLEHIGMTLLAQAGIKVTRLAGQPGLYVEGKKIASLGLKIKRGCSYHGMAINIDMDLSPFNRITPCGLTGMQMTQWSNHAPVPDWSHICQQLTHLLQQSFNYSSLSIEAQEITWRCPTSP